MSGKRVIRRTDDGRRIEDGVSAFKVKSSASEEVHRLRKAKAGELFLV